MEHVHLSKAPIAEAIIEIGVKLSADTSVTALKSLHAPLAAKYPNEKERRRWEGKATAFSYGGVEGPADDIDGFMFSSEDKKQVIQFRLDGFAINRLRPYESWEALVVEAKAGWSIYMAGVKPAVITKLAVRYLNVMDFPLPIKLDEYLRTAPDPLDVYPPNLVRCLQHSERSDPGTGLVANVTQAMTHDDKETNARVFLDIDVSKRLTAPVETVDPWHTLEILRVKKNDIFFGSITQRTVELYK